MINLDALKTEFDKRQQERERDFGKSIARFTRILEKDSTDRSEWVVFMRTK